MSVTVCLPTSHRKTVSVETWSREDLKAQGWSIAYQSRKMQMLREKGPLDIANFTLLPIATLIYDLDKGGLTFNGLKIFELLKEKYTFADSEVFDFFCEDTSNIPKAWSLCESILFWGTIYSGADANSGGMFYHSLSKTEKGRGKYEQEFPCLNIAGWVDTAYVLVYLK